MKYFDDVTDLQETWERLGDLDPAEGVAPTKGFEQRFAARLAAERQPRRTARWLALAAMLAIGVTTAVLGTRAWRTGGVARPTEDRVEHSQQYALHAVAPARLHAVNGFARRAADPTARHELAVIATHDPSIDVRLRALDLLEPYGAEPAIARRLIASAPGTQSTLLRIRLIELFADHGIDAARPVIDDWVRHPDTDELVRETARWGAGTTTCSQPDNTMRETTMRHLNRPTAALILAIALAPLAAADGPRAFEAEPLVGYFANAVEPGTFTTSVRWGELRVVGHDAVEVRIEPRIEVEASLAARFSDREIADRVQLELVERGDTIELRVDAKLDGFYSVDLTVWVPRDAAVGLEVRDGGNIQVEGVAGEVEVTNRNGSVDLAGLGNAAVVHARNGSINASFDTVSPDLPMSFSSLNGSVDVTFPESLAADVQVRYNRGGIESDFPIVAADGREAAVDVAGLDGRGTRRLEGRIAGGGPRYYFHTANGTVYLRSR